MIDEEWYQEQWQRITQFAKDWFGNMEEITLNE